MKLNVELFEVLLCSYSSNLQTVRNTNGRQTNDQFYKLNFEKTQSIWSYRSILQSNSLRIGLNNKFLHSDIV